MLWMTASMAMAQTERVAFSSPGGFYEQSFLLSLSCEHPNHHVRYTTNGNTPNPSSQRYEAPLFLDSHLYSSSDLFTITISPDSLKYVPDSVRHIIVIRAAVFDENDLCVSETFTNTYLIRSLMGVDSSKLPVVSLCSDSLSLFDYETGIMVPGTNWDPDDPLHTGNYYMKGKDWERTANVEFYESDGICGLNQTCGLRTHGNLSRRYPAKGLKVYARNEYGKSNFEYQIFPDSPLNKYKRLIFKPFAVFWPYSGTQDYFCNTLAHQSKVDAPCIRPALLYLNGEFWGIYFIQEKIDEEYLEAHFGVDEKNCNIIENWKGTAENGTNKNFLKMMRWMKDTDLSVDANYDRVCDLIDVDNFINYMIFETFVANKDWPGNNMRCWQDGNGPWKWVFFDGDAAIIHKDLDVFVRTALYTGPDTWSNYPEVTLLFGKLLENNQFKTTFKTRAQELCGNEFQYGNTSEILHDLIETLRPNIPEQQLRFGYPHPLSLWDFGNDLIDDFLYHRVERYLEAIDDFPLFKTDYRLSDLDQFICYPNPSEGIFTIRMKEAWPHSVEINIYSITGMPLYHKTLDTPEEEGLVFDSNLPAGVYIIQIGSCFQRLIIF